jgi:hypothetical protein
MDIFKDNFKDTKPSFPSPTTSLFFSTHSPIWISKDKLRRINKSSIQRRRKTFIKIF